MGKYDLLQRIYSRDDIEIVDRNTIEEKVWNAEWHNVALIYQLYADHEGISLSDNVLNIMKSDLDMIDAKNREDGTIEYNGNVYTYHKVNFVNYKLNHADLYENFDLIAVYRKTDGLFAASNFGIWIIRTE